MISMTQKMPLAGGLFALALGVASPVMAHHSFAMFDQTKIETKAHATVTEFRFTNPHSFVVVSVNAGRTTTSYALECSSVNMMSKAGWKFSTLKTGDVVDVTFYPLRNGKPGGMLKTVKLADGRTLSGW